MRNGLSTGARLLPALLLLVACHCASRQLVTRMYFGLSSPEGDISETQFRTFLDSAVTPRFPDGLTVYQAYGQWSDSGGGTAVKESSMVVEIVHTDTPHADSAIDRITGSYRAAFQQQSVLVVQVRPCRVRF
jgi:hypothetical protein